MPHFARHFSRISNKGGDAELFRLRRTTYPNLLPGGHDRHLTRAILRDRRAAAMFWVTVASFIKSTAASLMKAGGQRMVTESMAATILDTLDRNNCTRDIARCLGISSEKWHDHEGRRARTDILTIGDFADFQYKQAVAYKKRLIKAIRRKKMRLAKRSARIGIN